MKKMLGLLVLSSLTLLAFESEEVYKNCIMCHGKKADKKAISSSVKLALLSQESLAEKLKNIIDDSSSMSKIYTKMHKTKLKDIQSENGVRKFANYIIGLKE
ncbi:hypothetical protein [Sulfurimonas sp.]|uniref:hypothetical protein n=1 Tax=Sulfurimonas sp. TaxID=2022749 RepID=UPI003568527D